MGTELGASRASSLLCLVVAGVSRLVESTDIRRRGEGVRIIMILCSAPVVGDASFPLGVVLELARRQIR